MNIARRRVKVSPEEMSLHLKDAAGIILDRKRKGIPHAEISRRLSYDFYTTILFLRIWTFEELTLDLITQELDKRFEKPLHPKDNRYSRLLARQIPENDFFEREGFFLDNKLIKDLSIFLKDNNLKTQIVGLTYQKITLAIEKSEKEKIIDFMASWAAQFGSSTSIPFMYEDLTQRQPTLPKPVEFDPLIKKEKIIVTLP